MNIIIGQVLGHFEEEREEEWALSVLSSKAHRHQNQQPPVMLPQVIIGGDPTTGAIRCSIASNNIIARPIIQAGRSSSHDPMRLQRISKLKSRCLTSFVS
jgi:hypothetical protein